MSTAHEQAKRIAIIYVSAFVVLNAVFYALSGSYFDSHRQLVPGGGSMPSYTPEQMSHVRMTFAVFSGLIAAGGLVAGIRPHAVGHLLAALLGVMHIVAGIAALIRGLPGVLGMALWISGSLMVVLAWYSHGRSRPAWAFLVAICSVFAVVELFGAPKIRAVLDIGLWTTMILPGLNAVAATTLITLRGDYVERNEAAA